MTRPSAGGWGWGDTPGWVVGESGVLRFAIKMLVGDRGKYLGLVLGVGFTAFLVTFAFSYLSGILTRSFALVAENPGVDVWVMDPAVASVEPSVNLPDSALGRVRGVAGVGWATPLALAGADARLANGAFLPVEVVAVDSATLTGAPRPEGISAGALRADGAVFVDAGGTAGKLRTPADEADQWPGDGPHLGAATRDFEAGDELAVNDHMVRVAGVTHTLPRFPPRPLVYMTYDTALRILPRERLRTTFILVTAAEGVDARALAGAITAETGLRARSAADFRADTVRWTLRYSEDVGDMTAMLAIAGCVGLGGTGVLLFLFTMDNARYYAVLSAMGATPGLLTRMVLVQAAQGGAIGAGLGLGACALAVRWTASAGYPVRMMWFNPLIGAGAVVVVCLVAAAVSLRPVLRVQPAEAFAPR